MAWPGPCIWGFCSGCSLESLGFLHVTSAEGRYKVSFSLRSLVLGLEWGWATLSTWPRHMVGLGFLRAWQSQGGSQSCSMMTEWLQREAATKPRWKLLGFLWSCTSETVTSTTFYVQASPAGQPRLRGRGNADFLSMKEGHEHPWREGFGDGQPRSKLLHHFIKLSHSELTYLMCGGSLSKWWLSLYQCVKKYF